MTVLSPAGPSTQDLSCPLPPAVLTLYTDPLGPCRKVQSQPRSGCPSPARIASPTTAVKNKDIHLAGPAELPKAVLRSQKSATGH